MSDFEPKSLLILGRQPALGLAELESLYGPEHIQSLTGAALLDIPAEEINFKRLGGTIKVARLLTPLPSTSWNAAHKYLMDEVPGHLAHLPSGTFTLGLSVYGLDVNVRKLNADLLSLKKIIKNSGRSVRIVPNKTLELNSAQVLHNKLTHLGAWELLLLRDGSRTLLAQTLFIQDIEAYGARDQARPSRDARVGMLPPKLAQILINLAVGQLELPVDSKQLTVKKLETKDSGLETKRALRVLDPFCGTGVILQEALLMGYHVIGTDIEPKLVAASQKNIQWLVAKYPNIEGQVVIEEGDATNYQWPRFSTVASEVYLGRPLSSLPGREKLSKIVEDVNTILKKFLKNLAPQLRAKQKVVLAVPAWKNGQNFKHLPLLANLTDVGYNRIALKHVGFDELIYYREDQIVARELLILEKASNE